MGMPNAVFSCCSCFSWLKKRGIPRTLKAIYYQLESVRCKNRIFPKNPVFLYISDYKTKFDKASGSADISDYTIT